MEVPNTGNELLGGKEKTKLFCAYCQIREFKKTCKIFQFSNLNVILNKLSNFKISFQTEVSSEVHDSSEENVKVSIDK